MRPNDQADACANRYELQEGKESYAAPQGFGDPQPQQQDGLCSFFGQAALTLRAEKRQKKLIADGLVLQKIRFVLRKTHMAASQRLSDHVRPPLQLRVNHD